MKDRNIYSFSVYRWKSSRIEGTTSFCFLNDLLDQVVVAGNCVQS